MLAMMLNRPYSWVPLWDVKYKHFNYWADDRTTDWWTLTESLQDGGSISDLPSTYWRVLRATWTLSKTYEIVNWAYLKGTYRLTNSYVWDKHWLWFVTDAGNIEFILYRLASATFTLIKSIAWVATTIWTTTEKNTTLKKISWWFELYSWATLVDTIMLAWNVTGAYAWFTKVNSLWTAEWEEFEYQI